MNDIAKQSIKIKLEKAIASEGLSKSEVAEVLGFHPSYISWFGNPKYWDKLGNFFWDKTLPWVNSGQSLKEFQKKKGKVLCPKSDKTVPESKESVPELVKIVP